MELWICDTRRLAPYRADAAALLSAERRRKLLACAGEEAALLSLGAGLLLRRFVGAGPFPPGARGKPENPGGPCFSLSHSGGLAVLAVDAAPVGADVEPLERRFTDGAARRVFAAEEYAAWDGAARGFFTLWTRKEAVLKATGLGFALPPRSFCVLPGRPCRADGRVWALGSAEYDGHMLSAAVEGAGEELRLRPVPVGAEELLKEACT